ncbi:MAG TPA: helix-turn-helix domain-containing protein [Streptosporangiaceae bacterium]|nr:helix-turn-helix domain-containing protein [Streptosporangiaceae bacterium]
MSPSHTEGRPSATATADLDVIARAASREAGGVPPDLLGDYLPAVLDAARTGRRLVITELAGYGRSGERAAESGVALRGLVDLFLSATWRLWRELPGLDARTADLRAAGLGVLRAADDAVAAAAEGFERAHLSIARREEAERLEFVDDLLSGRGGAADLLVRGERLGLRLAGPHVVVLAGYAAGVTATRPLGKEIDRLVAEAAAPSPSLTVTRGGRFVAVTGVTDGGEVGRVAVALVRALTRGHPDLVRDDPRPWRVAFGRAYPGPGGVRRSYDEAGDALDVAQRLGMPDPVVDAADLLVYQVLLRDRAAITDLVGALLTPLAGARGGAQPLLATLQEYYACGGVAVEAARRLHLSVRAVTYRLARVKALTGHDPADPAQGLALRVAVIGARMLDWPATAL